jgi:hypothetical protein
MGSTCHISWQTDWRDMRCLLIAVLLAGTLSAGTLITVTCQAGGTIVIQSDPSSAQCVATDPPKNDQAYPGAGQTLPAASETNQSELESRNGRWKTVGGDAPIGIARIRSR